jgi:hypothetical protein
MFTDGDLPAFADLLARLYADPESGRQMAARARRFTRDHAWANEFTGYVALLQRLLRRPVASAPGS